MIHYKERKDRIHIITLDAVIAEDICERLGHYAGLESVRVIKPAAGKSMKVTAEHILHSAKETLASKIIIFDVRNQTRPMLQRAFSDIVRFNRQDLNRYCYSVLIGDGPVNLAEYGNSIHLFQNYLADLRVDFNPAVYFCSLFLRYSYEETQRALYNNNTLPTKIPSRHSKYFTEEDLTIKKLSQYFRASEVHKSERLKKRKSRLEKLRKLYEKILAEEFPDDKDELVKAMTKEGCSLPGESLRIHLYPFHFEEWILELMKKDEQEECEK